MIPDNILHALKAADALRRRWKAGMRPAYNLFDLADQHNVLVFRMVLDPSLSGAFIRSKRQRTSVVVINTNNKNLHHQRFTLAHELGHLELHKDQDGFVEAVEESSDDSRELEANFFAAQLLVPRRELEKLLKTYGVVPADVPDRLIIELARAFGVSHHVILRRLTKIQNGPSYEDIQVRLDNTDWNAFWKLYAPDDHHETIPDSPRPTWKPDGVSKATAATISTFPKMYREMAFEAYRRDKITAGKLAEILSLPSKQVVIEEIRPLVKPQSHEKDKKLDEVLGKIASVKDD